MAAVVEDSSTRTPLIFVLSPGVVSCCCCCFFLYERGIIYLTVIARRWFVFLINLQDPTSALLQLAENSGMSNRFHALSLGQGQAPIATRMIKEGVKDVRYLIAMYISKSDDNECQDVIYHLCCSCNLVILPIFISNPIYFITFMLETDDNSLCFLAG